MQVCIGKEVTLNESLVISRSSTFLTIFRVENILTLKIIWFEVLKGLEQAYALSFYNLKSNPKTILI